VRESTVNNDVAAYIHRTVCKHVGLQDTDKFYKHIPERFINVNGTTIMWDVSVITDRTVLANRPDIVLCDKRDKTYPLFDIAIRNDPNINAKDTEKLSKYKDLENEVSRMWKVRIKTVPVII